MASIRPITFNLRDDAAIAALEARLEQVAARNPTVHHYLTMHRLGHIAWEQALLQCILSLSAQLEIHFAMGVTTERQPATDQLPEPVPLPSPIISFELSEELKSEGLLQIQPGLRVASVELGDSVNWLVTPADELPLEPPVAAAEDESPTEWFQRVMRE